MKTAEVMFPEILSRLDVLLERLEHFISEEAPLPDWNARAFRWQTSEGADTGGLRSLHSSGSGGSLRSVRHPQLITPDDLLGIEQQKQRLMQNTRQFVAGLPANNALLSGARGTGKSSLIKAVFNTFADKGLRLIEINRDGLAAIPTIIDLVAEHSERFILYCDDLSFAADEPGHTALKSALDGSIVNIAPNILIYASSNRRHLMPEHFWENRIMSQDGDEEIHLMEAVEEKISLSERFGLWLSFYPFDQQQYLAICMHWLTQMGLPPEEQSVSTRERIQTEALQWALERGGRNGRVAWQFACDFVGAYKLVQSTVGSTYK